MADGGWSESVRQPLRQPPSVTRHPSSFLISSHQWPGSKSRARRWGRRPSKVACRKGSGSSVRPVRRSSITKILLQDLQRLPQVRPSFPDERGRSSEDAVRRCVDGIRRRTAVHRSAEVHRHQTLSRPTRIEHRGDRPEGRRDLRRRTPQRRRDRHRRDGVRFHRRQHGGGRRREDHAADRAGPRPAVAGDHRLVLRRRADDGGRRCR